MEEELVDGILPINELEIPPPPTREEELAYLDKLEKEIRSQSYYDSGFPPDPARKYIRERSKQEKDEKFKRKNKLVLGALIFSPLSLWLADKSPAKACPMGIPYRSYANQHKIRYFSFFLAYEFIFAWTFYYLSLDQKTLDKHRFPLNTIRERKL